MGKAYAYYTTSMCAHRYSVRLACLLMPLYPPPPPFPPAHTHTHCILSQSLVRVAAIDAGSLRKALIVLTAADRMSGANSGHMLTFQPTEVGPAAAEPPKLPEGSMVLYTARVPRGKAIGA